MGTERVIKKYPNRRLYDTALGIYITLEDVKQLVFDHVDFKVIDARTKKDITQNTLLQIITEQEATSTPIFTNAMLQDLIRFYHEKSQTILSQYLEQTMRLFSEQKDFFKNQWASSQKLFFDPSLLQQIWNLSTLPQLKPITGQKKKTSLKRKRKKKNK